jgi:cell division protein ZapE
LAAEKLESLHHAVMNYRPAEGVSGWRARFGLQRRTEMPPQGLYIVGAVGRGKSMLMDLFFASAPVERKRRVHFHAFMLEVHARLHAWRKANAGDATTRDPLPIIARDLAEQAWLLCFDEFQVTNIADAMILARLLQGLLEHGVVVVTTSNTAPDDLYADGLQRESFLPAIALIKERLDLLSLDGDIDYRRARIKGMTVYHAPLGPAAHAEGAFARLTDGEAGRPETVYVQGRTLRISRAARGVAWATFSELCERAVGVADYIALAELFHTLIVEGIPTLKPEQRNEARRFVTLVDALYEHRVKLIATAAAPPDALYPVGEHQAEFRRTASRLHEMQGAEYLAMPHLP